MFDKLEAINDTVRNTVFAEMTEVQPEDIGFSDRRVGYRFWITEDTIAVQANYDAALRYYGGFEYVEAEYRTQYGEWVFYFADDARVANHLDGYYATEDAE